MRVAGVIWHGYITVISPSMDHKCFILSHPKIELSPSTLCNEVIVCLREAAISAPYSEVQYYWCLNLPQIQMKNLSLLTFILSRWLLLYLASCIFLFSLSHHALFHSFSKVKAEGLLFIPAFLEGRLAAVSSFLAAQNSLLWVLSDQDKWCSPTILKFSLLLGSLCANNGQELKKINFHG